MESRKQKVAIVTSGYFPIPATLGGAVEALDENLLKQNEKSKRINFVVFSCWNEAAVEEAKKYYSANFVFIKTPLIIRFGDKCIYFAAKNILKIKKNMSYRYILQRLYFIKKVAKNLYRNDYDKVILENHSTLFMVLKKHQNYRKYEGKYYYHLHNIVTNDYGCREILCNCRKVIGVSDYINNTLRGFLDNDDHNEYCVLRNKIDRDKFLIKLNDKDKERIRNEFGLSLDDQVVLFTGRFNEEKGINELLHAFKKIQKENIKLLVVGGYYFGSGMISQFESEMYELAKEMNDGVKFTGFIPYEKMPELYAVADIVVIPSIWDDPAPLTVIEALTSGKALITTNSGGIPEYADNQSSIILKRGDNLIDDLASAIKNMLENDQERKQTELKVRSKTEKWNIEAFYNDFCSIIEVPDEE